jgi:hypothetical protein
MGMRCQETKKKIEQKMSLIYEVVNDNSGQYETNATIIPPSNEAGLGGAI